MLTALTVKRLRRIEQFMLNEPRRFDMREGIRPANDIRSTILKMPPCGTACCIGGSAYIVGKRLRNLKNVEFGWSSVRLFSQDWLGLTDEEGSRLFFVRGLHSENIETSWPIAYGKLYMEAKTPLERVYIGIARIEHFIATGGME